MNVLINDLSGIGKVALSPMTTILNCSGLEIVSLPTTILSSHTGGFDDIFIDRYNDQLKEFLKQWQGLNIDFNSLITGYFSSKEQIENIIAFKNTKQCANAKLIVDPVMADNGKLYSGFTKDYINTMKKLVKNADLILPNYTEACLLTSSKYNEDNATINEIKSLTLALSQNKNKNVIITGIKKPKTILISYYDKKNDKLEIIETEKLPYNFHGTGDIFTAIISSYYLQNISIQQAIINANNWLLQCLKYTILLKRDLKYGVRFEPFLKELITLIENSH